MPARIHDVLIDHLAPPIVRWRLHRRAELSPVLRPAAARCRSVRHQAAAAGLRLRSRRSTLAATFRRSRLARGLPPRWPSEGGYKVPIRKWRPETPGVTLPFCKQHFGAEWPPLAFTTTTLGKDCWRVPTATRTGV